MGDESTCNRDAETAQARLVKYIEESFRTDFEPYANLIVESLDRCMKLVTAAKPESEVSSEILRAVVVLNHAYLEDFMRTLALTFLPIASESVLDRVPLAGHGQTNRAEKFFIGKLAQHRGKTIDAVILESVSKYVDRSTFNSLTEIMSFLESIGLQLPDEKDKNSLSITGETLAMLDAMMQRRHYIAHRADKGKDGRLQDISSVEVSGWLGATVKFTLNIAKAAFMKRFSFEELTKKAEAMQEEIEKTMGENNRSLLPKVIQE